MIFTSPTETVFGIFTSFEDNSSIERIYEIKKRDKAKKLMLLAYDLPTILQLFSINTYQRDVIYKNYHQNVSFVVEIDENYFKSGNLILNPQLYDIYDGRKYTGFRITKLSVLVNFMKEHNLNILAQTSLNISGEPATIDSKDIPHELRKQIDFIIEGIADSGQPSKIIRLLEDKIELIRENNNIKIN